MSEYEKAVEALERIRLETSNVCVNTNLDIIEEILKQTKENVNVIEQYKKEKEHIREWARKCIKYIKCNKIYKEDGYWKDLIFCLEEEQYGDFIEKVLNSGVTCDFAYKMLEVLNKSTTLEKKMNKYEEILNIIEKRTHIGTMSRDYGKTVDDVLTINNANELIMLEEALKQSIEEHELLELYRMLINLEEEYRVSDSILKQQKVLDVIRDVRERISQIEDEK